MLKKIVLIGFRATGKSTVGRLLAEKLSWEFVDLDLYLEERLGKTIREVVEEEGWEAFRRVEKEALERFSPRSNLVLALGGGAVMHEKEMETLSRGALVVWLKADPETILKRLESDPRTHSQRPSLTGEDPYREVKKLLKERAPLYARFAHLEIETRGLSPEKIVLQILRGIPQSLKG